MRRRRKRGERRGEREEEEEIYYTLFPEGLSFSKAEETCQYHRQKERWKRCYCVITQETCNSFNCPRRRRRAWFREEESGNRWANQIRSTGSG